MHRTLVAADKNQFVWSNLHKIKQYLLIFLSFFHFVNRYVCTYTYLLITICATIIQGRKLIKGGNYWLLRGFYRGNYSRAETIRGNTVCIKKTTLVKFSFSERATKTHFFLQRLPPSSITQHNLKEEKKIFEVCTY